MDFVFDRNIFENSKLIEEQLVGAILIDSKAFDLARPFCESDDFLDASCRYLFEAALRLTDEGQKIDSVTLQAKVAQFGQELPFEYLTRLMNATAPNTATNAKLYAQRIHEAGQKRRLQTAAREAFDSPTATSAEIAAQLCKAADNVRCRSDRPRSSADWCKLVMERMAQAPQILQTGYKGLDAVLGGFLNGGLYIFAARPGVGKTAFLLNLAEKIQAPTLFVSLEMSGEQLLFRRIAAQSGVPVMAQLQQTMSEDAHCRWAEAVGLLSQSPMIMADDILTLAQIEAEARAVDGLKAVFVDYLQLAQTGTSADDMAYTRVTATSDGLKQLAKRLNVPVIAASQLKRSTSNGKTTTSKPTLECLRESGAIEQDADAVALMYTDSEDGETVVDQREVVLDIAKNRHGKTGSLTMRFYTASGVFAEEV